MLLALAATAYHATAGSARRQPELIIGHGVLGRLLARLAVAAGGDAGRLGAQPARARRRRRLPGRRSRRDDPRRDYRAICDVSGDAALLDTLIARLAPGGEIVLAGFYDEPLSLRLPARLHARGAHPRRRRVDASPTSRRCRRCSQSGRLSLDGLITHRRRRPSAGGRYRTAFDDPACLKMILDWRDCA